MGERMSIEEALAVATHLKTNTPQISQLLSVVLGATPLERITQRHRADSLAGEDAESKRSEGFALDAVSVDDIKHFLLSCPITDLHRKSSAAERPAPEDYLYTRGRSTCVCTIILNGKVTVMAGRDGFRAEVGAWSVLSADALVFPLGSYLPDFSAYISSNTLRCIRIQMSSAQSMLKLKPVDSDVDAVALQKEAELRKAMGMEPRRIHTSSSRGIGVGGGSPRRTAQAAHAADMNDVLQYRLSRRAATFVVAPPRTHASSAPLHETMSSNSLEVDDDAGADAGAAVDASAECSRNSITGRTPFSSAI